MRYYITSDLSLSMLSPRALHFFNFLQRVGGKYTKTSYWSKRKIAAELGVSEKTVSRAQSELVHKGFILVQQRYDKNGRQKSSLYKIIVPLEAEHEFSRFTDDVDTLKGRELQVYMFIRRKCGETGYRVSRRKIAHELNISLPTVSRITRKLAVCGWIDKAYAARPNTGEQGWNRYAINRLRIRHRRMLLLVMLLLHVHESSRFFPRHTYPLIISVPPLTYSKLTREKRLDKGILGLLPVAMCRTVRRQWWLLKAWVGKIFFAANGNFPHSPKQRERRDMPHFCLSANYQRPNGRAKCLICGAYSAIMKGVETWRVRCFMTKVINGTFRKDGKVYRWSVPEEMNLEEKSWAIVHSSGVKTIVYIQSVETVEDDEAVGLKPVLCAAREREKLAVSLSKECEQRERRRPRKKKSPKRPRTGRHVDIALREKQRWEEAGIDISPYWNQGFTTPQLVEIRRGILIGINVQKYAIPGMKPGEMRQKRWSMIEPLAAYMGWLPDTLTREQRREIMLGIEARVDVAQYANPKLGHHVMRLLRECLEAGMDVSRMKTLSRKEISAQLRAHLTPTTEKAELSSERPVKRRGAAEGIIRAYLAAHPEATRGEIARATGYTWSTVNKFWKKPE